jgi:hypothetical protein
VTWVTWVEVLELRRFFAAGPIVITRGGTYSGSWENLTDRTPVITIKTTEPVVIQNATIKGKGHLIQSTIVEDNISIYKSRRGRGRLAELARLHYADGDNFLDAGERSTLTDTAAKSVSFPIRTTSSSSRVPGIAA